jgi:hypothetical protein
MLGSVITVTGAMQNPRDDDMDLQAISALANALAKSYK